MISGIMPDTPLGKIVMIRSEKDPKVLKNFSKEQKRIRNEWVQHKNKKKKEEGKSAIDWAAFQAWAKQSFS